MNRSGSRISAADISVVFWGYHLSGELTLKELLRNGLRVSLVVLPCGRDTSGIENIARKRKIPVTRPRHLKKNTVFLSKLKRLAPQAFIVDSYDKLIPAEFLDIPAIGAYNFHEALLPKYRGQHIMNWALINGEKESGLTVHRMTARFDEGGIVTQRRVRVEEWDDIDTLYEKICGTIPAAVKILAARLKKKSVRTKKQDFRKATYFHKRSPEDGRIDWNKSAKEIYYLIRALKKPWPNAFSCLGETRVSINDALPVDLRKRGASVPGEILRLKKRKYPFVICGDGRLLEIREADIEPAGSALSHMKNGMRFTRS